MTCWRLLSYLPGTTPHRVYRDAVAFVDRTEAFLDEQPLPSGRPRFPRPIPRDPECCLVAVQSMMALLRSAMTLALGGSGRDARAAFEEHFPDLSAIL